MDRSRTEDEQTRTRDVTRQPSEDDQSWRREHNSLEVTIISAQGLRDTRIFGKMSSYALAWIDSDVKYCTHVAHNAGCNPAWDHKMYIALPPMGTELNVQIFSRGSGNNDPLVGSTKIPLAHVSHSGLQYMACQLLTPSGRIQGLLNISVRTCTSDSEALESSTLKRSIEVSGSFKAPNSDSPVGDDGDEYDRTGIDLSDPASSSCQTPAPRHRRHSGKFTAPDILDFGAVEDPGNPVQQRERRERDWEKEREQRERERERERERDRERERERQQERDRERERGQWEKERDRDRERERERDRERERERSRGQTTERDRERERSRGQLTGVSGGTSGTGGSGGGTTGGDQAGGDLGGSNTVDGGALGTYYLGSAMDHLPGQ